MTVNVEISKEREPICDHCGIVAAFSPRDIPFFLSGLAGLSQLQTRGYDGAGFYCVTTAGQTFQYKAEGLIGEVFNSEIINKYKDIKASIWLYETRYGTYGATRLENIQPIIRKHVFGETFAVIHNGQFSEEIGSREGKISDTAIFADQLAASSEETWDERILNVLNKKNGAWSAIVGTSDSLYLMRDKYGVRPLAFGRKVSEINGQDVWLVASETSALKILGINLFYEVLPGSVIKISRMGAEYVKTPAHNSHFEASCIFENIYIGDGKSAMHLPRREETEINESPEIDKFRKRCGVILAKEAPLTLSYIDIAIGIPGTGITGGKSYAEALGIPYLQAVTDRNPQIDPRTFMTPNINDIFNRVLEHFHFNENFLRGLRVVLIDDSIVRGNVQKGIIKLMREKYGVSQVHVRILCPPIDKSCYLGINTRQDSELIAARQNGDVEAIRREINADSLVFLSDRGLYEAAGKFRGFCLGCMLNHHPPIDRKGNSI